jgi:DNA-binding transcriptional LysR family regulator
MTEAPRISLEQWRALQAVVEEGGYAQAAQAMHKSQSTLTYAVQKIESLLDLAVFEIQGRKAVLTDAGHVLYRRARTLLEEAATLERGAAAMSAEWQPEIAIAVEVIFPTWLLLECLGKFARERPETRIEVYETVLTGTGEMLAAGRVDFAIGSDHAGVTGERLMAMEAVAVAHRDHPLHHLGRKVTPRDLRAHRRILLRDTAVQRDKEVSGVELRWTVSHKATSIRALSMGLGYAWVFEETIREELASGLLKPLPLTQGATRRGEVFLQFADPEFPGRDAARLADIIREGVAGACRKEKARASRGRHA